MLTRNSAQPLRQSWILVTEKESHRQRQVAVVVGGAAVVGLVLRLPPLQDDAPGDHLQRHRDAAQDADGDDVPRLPLLLHVQDAHALEDVDDAQDDDGVAHRVVVHVPVHAQLVILLRPQKQCKDLDEGKSNVLVSSPLGNWHCKFWCTKCFKYYYISR